MLSYAKQISERRVGGPVRECVITIPPFFNPAQRTAMLHAAEIAGLKVLSLLHESTAFALKCEIGRAHV